MKKRSKNQLGGDVPTGDKKTATNNTSVNTYGKKDKPPAAIENIVESAGKKEKKHREKKQKNPARSRKIWQRGLLITALLGLGFVLFGSVYILGLSAWNDFDPKKITNANQTMLLYDAQGELISGVYGTENRLNIPFNQIPVQVRNALIAMEDVRFYEHSGVDLRRIVGALWVDLRSRSLSQGASTVTQQLVKLSHLSSEKTWSRKIEEAILALQMERQYSKDEILEMYFNYVYFGAGAYGIEAAAQEYFGKSANQLSIAQGALLVGVLKSPTRYAPHLNLEASIKRRNLVLDQMQLYGFLGADECAKAKEEKVELVMSDNSKYPHGFYVELAMKEAREALGISQEELLCGGYRIYTALNTKIQNQCEELFEDDTLFPPAINGQSCEAAIVLLDANSRNIVAMLGARQYTVKMGLNRATQVKRQPGSAIKPIIVYAPAIEKFGYTTTSFLLDQQTDFDGYEPRNFNDSYNGWVTVRESLTRSLNVPAVKVLSDIGVHSGKSFANSLGIDFDAKDVSLSLALGGFTYGVTPLELCNAYASFPSGGVYDTAKCVTRIEKANGDVVYAAQGNPVRVMNDSTAFIMTTMLESVIKDGTGRRLNIGIPLAGKTGTTGLKETGGNKDAWMVAYNPQYVATIWMGYDDTNQYYNLPSEATGGTYPAALLSRIFEDLYPDISAAPDFQMPNSVVEIDLDATSLKKRQQVMLANALTPETDMQKEYYTKDTVPTKGSDYWVVPTPPGGLSATPGIDGKPILRITPEERFVMYRIYRDQEGALLMLGEFPGDMGEIVCVDSDAQYGKTYEYYVVPIHPESSVNGETIEGPPSKRLAYRVPFPGEKAQAVSLSEDQTLQEVPQVKNSGVYEDPRPNTYSQLPQNTSPNISSSTTTPNTAVTPGLSQSKLPQNTVSPSMTQSQPQQSAEKKPENSQTTGKKVSPSRTPNTNGDFDLIPDESTPPEYEIEEFELY